MTLAGRLGRFAAQLFSSNLAEIEVKFEGEVGGLKTQLIRASAVAAILSSDGDEANVINALAAAEERGVVVRESRTDPEARVNLIHLKLAGPTGSVECSGALVHGSSPRLIHLNGIDIESHLEGDFLVVGNIDAPGVVGSIGTLLGRKGINIARLSLGREGRRALAIVQVDEHVGPDVLASLRQAGSVQSVALVKV